MTFSHKAVILGLLRNASGIVSGEAISRQTGISRVAVWKHMRSLQSLGYGIEAGTTGYRLKNSPDGLFAWEFGNREPIIHHFDHLDSTMNAARKLARDHCPAFSVVIAERQTRGRGRLNRHWSSERGGLYFTVVLRPRISPLQSARINLYACLALAQTLQDHLDITAAVKWPNDILVENRKLAGMLAEMETEGDVVSFINVGMGVNINNDPTRHEPRAISLQQILGRRVARRPLLEAFLDRLEAGFAQATDDAVIARWKTHTVTLNRQVKVVTHDRVFHGRAVDMDPSGALILKQTDGSIVMVTHGDCFYDEQTQS